MHVRPTEGDTADVRATVPLNPWSEVTVMAEVPETPARGATVVGLAKTVKSCRVNVTATE